MPSKTQKKIAWFFMDGDTWVGPKTENEIIKLHFEGVIDNETLCCSSKTGLKWVPYSQTTLSVFKDKPITVASSNKFWKIFYNTTNLVVFATLSGLILLAIGFIHQKHNNSANHTEKTNKPSNNTGAANRIEGANKPPSNTGVANHIEETNKPSNNTSATQLHEQHDNNPELHSQPPANFALSTRLSYEPIANSKNGLWGCKMEYVGATDKDEKQVFSSVFLLFITPQGAVGILKNQYHLSPDSVVKPYNAHLMRDGYDSQSMVTASSSCPDKDQNAQCQIIQDIPHFLRGFLHAGNNVTVGFQMNPGDSESLYSVPMNLQNTNTASAINNFNKCMGDTVSRMKTMRDRGQSLEQ
jgi:hypothetical protein